MYLRYLPLGDKPNAFPLATFIFRSLTSESTPQENLMWKNPRTFSSAINEWLWTVTVQPPGSYQPYYHPLEYEAQGLLRDIADPRPELSYIPSPISASAIRDAQSTASIDFAGPGHMEQIIMVIPRPGIKVLGDLLPRAMNFQTEKPLENLDARSKKLLSHSALVPLVELLEIKSWIFNTQVRPESHPRNTSSERLAVRILDRQVLCIICRD